ncbi:hypothetical protein BDN72DRAFT_322590 [Pluteus cervinus]|uniref:Uncharacterized protein n=1 Tax=Pluteus cervinus TaxID=181527 RepID=A0ACD3AD05_9AGAR|nr:hypothetical protein BDN72DRAFT_322590 [Pluteus cervinus]
MIRPWNLGYNRILRIKGDQHTYIDKHLHQLSLLTLNMATEIAEHIQVQTEAINKLVLEIQPQVEEAAKNAEPEKVMRALVSAFDNAQVTAHFSAEITNMANTVRDIRKGFEEVSRDLGDFDKHHYKKADGSPVGELRTTWEAYYEDYKTLLRDSQKDAMDLKLICDHYIEIVVPALKDKSVTAQELKGIAEEYKQKTIPHERTSDFYAKAFYKLSLNLTDFRHTIRNTLAEAKAGSLEAFKVQITNLEGQVQQLKELINKQREFITECVKKAQDAIGTKKGSVIGLGIAFLFPIVAPFALGAYVVGAYTEKKANEARAVKEQELKESEKKLGELETQIAGLKTQQQDFAELETRLNACDNKIESIATKVGAFGEFWKAVNLDAKLILKKLDSAMAANVTYGDYALRKELSDRGVASLYTALRDALVHYTFEANV